MSRPIETGDGRLLSVTSVGYYVVILVHLLLLWTLAALPGADLSWLYCTASVATALGAFVMTYRSTRVAVTPLTLFAFIWLLLVPLASFEAPLMRRATSEEIWTCLVGGIAFSVGGIIVALLYGADAFQSPPSESRYRAPTSDGLSRMAALLLYASILALLVNTLLGGGFALLRDSDAERKAQSAFFGYPLLSSLGTIALVVFARSARVAKRYVIASVVYLVLQLLTGQRFVAIVGLVLVLVTLASFKSAIRPSANRILVVGLGVVAAFLFVANYRGGESDQRQYFLETGLYSGDPSVLSTTEIVRYVGMSQRNMSTVMARPFDPDQFLQYTLSPFVSLFGDPLPGLGTSIHGYTANNAIAYFYHDVGSWWPVLALLWAVVINWVYWQSRRRPESVTLGFMWCVSALGLTLSFFAYVSSYVYWVVLFPCVVSVMETSTRSKVEVTTSETTVCAIERRLDG